VKTVDRIHKGCCSHIQVSLDCSLHDLGRSVRHDLFQSSIYDIDLSGTLQQISAVKSFCRQVGSLLDDVQEVLLCLLLPFSIHSAWSHVLEVLEPFEVTDRYTSCIAQNIGQKLNPLSFQNLLTLHGGWSISSLNNKFGLELVSVVYVDGLL
jgi:hypothetical protein